MIDTVLNVLSPIMLVGAACLYWYAFEKADRLKHENEQLRRQAFNQEPRNTPEYLELQDLHRRTLIQLGKLRKDKEGRAHELYIEPSSLADTVRVSSYSRLYMQIIDTATMKPKTGNTDGQGK